MPMRAFVLEPAVQVGTRLVNQASRKERACTPKQTSVPEGNTGSGNTQHTVAHHRRYSAIVQPVTLQFLNRFIFLLHHYNAYNCYFSVYICIFFYDISLGQRVSCTILLIWFRGVNSLKKHFFNCFNHTHHYTQRIFVVILINLSVGLLIAWFHKTAP